MTMANSGLKGLPKCKAKLIKPKNCLGHALHILRRVTMLSYKFPGDYFIAILLFPYMKDCILDFLQVILYNPWRPKGFVNLKSS